MVYIPRLKELIPKDFNGATKNDLKKLLDKAKKWRSDATFEEDKQKN